MARDCTIKATDLTKVYGTPTPLIAQLLDNNTPLSNKNIVIHINNVDYRRTTDSNGKVSLNINLLPGNYSTDIKFAGDATYNATTKSVVVKVLRNDTPQGTVKGKGNYFEINMIPLNVIMKDGFSTTMGTSVKETDLLMQSSTLNAPTFYFNSGDHGVEFDISIVMKEAYYYNDLKVADYLNMWNKNIVPVSVVTDAMDVPNSKYIMSIKSKKQTSKSISTWKLHFHQFYENQLSFENMFTEKVGSLSAIDQLLVKYQVIDKNSPKDVILALQTKLKDKGCFTNTIPSEIYVGEDGEYYDYKIRVPNGVWDDLMPGDIYGFQMMAGINKGKNGECDRETIIALLDTNFDGVGYYEQRGIEVFGLQRESNGG